MPSVVQAREVKSARVCMHCDESSYQILKRLACAALTQFRPPPKEEEGHNLLTGGAKEGAEESAPSTGQAKPSQTLLDDVDSASDSDSGSEAEDEPWMPYVKPNMTISMVQIFEAQNLNGLQPHMDKALQMSNAREKYYPIIYFNEFWTLTVCIQVLRMYILSVTAEFL